MACHTYTGPYWHIMPTLVHNGISHLHWSIMAYHTYIHWSITAYHTYVHWSITRALPRRVKYSLDIFHPCPYIGWFLTYRSLLDCLILRRIRQVVFVKSYSSSRIRRICIRQVTSNTIAVNKAKTIRRQPIQLGECLLSPTIRRQPI